jgi:hypothetical protein
MLVFCHSVIINEHFLSFTALEMTYVVSDLFNSPYTVPVDPPKLLFERLCSYGNSHHFDW